MWKKGKKSRLVAGILSAIGLFAWGVGNVQAEDMTEVGKVIDMSKAGNITYDTYSGHANFYLYGLDTKDPTQVQGGTITIKKAEKYSQYSSQYAATINLVADSTGVDVSDNHLVQNVLENLASKLTYSAYADGERNLTGTVQLAEGLTTSSMYYMSSAKQASTLHFDDKGNGTVNSPVIKMGKDSSDIDIDTYNEIKQVYVYDHDAQDPTKILGGNITIHNTQLYNANYINGGTGVDGNNTYPAIWLVTDTNGIDVNDSAQLKDVLNALAGKLAFTASSKYGLSGYAIIGEGITSSSWIDAYGSISFDNTTGIGGVSYITQNHIYKDMVTENGALTQGPNKENYFTIKLAPEVTDNSQGAILAAIKPVAGDDAMNLTLAGGSSNQFGTSGTIIDVSAMNAPNGKVYGIYNGSGRELKSSGYATLTIQGYNPNYVAALYAVGTEDGKKSSISIAYNAMTVNAEQDGITAVEAGKDGEISFPNSSGTFTLNSNGHKINGFVADEGGTVTIGQNHNNRAHSASIDTHGGKALWAKDGGTINFWNNSTYLYNVDGDIVTEGTGKIVGTLGFSGGTWNGNLDAAADVALSNTVWNGDVLNSDATVTLGSTSTWTGQMINNSNLGLAISTWNDTAKGDTVIGTLSGSIMRGLRGLITKTSGDLTINKLDGQVIIGYTHDEKNPTNLIGPNVTVKTATEGSAIALRTDSNGIDLTDDKAVQKIFDAMAKKLTYEEYTDGVSNLTGSLEIAEGLTAGAQSLKVGQLTFDDKTGVGTAIDGVSTAYNSAVTGDMSKDVAFKDVGKEDGNTTTYTFNQDTYINNTINIKGATADPSNMKYGVTINPDEGKTIVFDMNGHDLTIENNIGQGTMAQSTTSVIYPVNTKTNVIINNPGKIDLSTFTAGYYAGAIAAGNRYAKTTDANLVQINNKPGWDNVVKARGVMGMGGTSSSSIFNVNWTTSKVFNHGHVDIKGWVDWYAYGAWNLSAIGDDGWIKIGGGKLISENYTSLDAYSSGTLWINAEGTGDNLKVMDESNVVQIGGNMKGSGQWVGAGSGGFINVGFTTKDSWFDGIANATGGSINLIFKNGAQWTNKDGGFKYGADASFDGTAESTVDYFYGGSSEKDTGYIQQAQQGDLTFNHFNGYTTVYYAHDAEDASQLKGGYTVVNNAEKGATIAIRTDNDGIDTNNTDQVSKVLNSLASKLVYNGYTSGERNLTGYAEIAEGFTSSSVLKRQDIIFDDNSGTGRVTKDPLGQTVTLFTKQLTGNPDTDKTYKRAGTIIDGKYSFASASVIEPTANINTGAINVRTPYSYSGTTEYKTVDIEAKNGLTLKLDNAASSMQRYGVYTGNGSTLNYTGDLSIEGTNTYTNGTVYGIYQQGESWQESKEAHTTIDGNVDMKLTNDIADGSKAVSTNTPRNERVVGILNTEQGASTIDVNGMVDIDVEGTGVSANSTKSADGTINIKGGRIIAEKVNTQTQTYDSAAGKYVYTDGILNNHALAAYAGTINMGMEKAEDGTWQAGSTRVQLEGNILALKDETTSAANRNLLDGTINVALTTPNSYWKGVADNAETVVPESTSTESKLGTFNLYIKNGGLWTNEKQGETYNYQQKNNPLGGSWDGISHVTNLTGGSEASNRGLIAQTEDTPIEIDHYSGYTLISFGHNTADPTKIVGGDVTIKTADKGSFVSLLTDRDGIDLDDKTQVTDVLSALAKKLIYSDAGNADTKDNLKGEAIIGEGLTSPWAAYQLGDISFDETTGQGVLDPDSVKENTADTNPIYKGAYETLIMSGTKSAMASSAMLWRTGLQDMGQRLGDLHGERGLDGVWGNMYGGKSKLSKDNGKYDTNYRVYQAGYDKAISKDWRVGVGISYADGDADYVLGGEGQLKNTIFSVYGTQVKADGSYLDIVAKGGKVKNEFTVYNEMGHHVKGDYDTTGYGLSVEYGKRLSSENGFYIEPQAQLVYGRLNSKQYRAGSDMIDGKGNQRYMDVSQDAFDSFVGRIGVAAGKTLRSGNSFFMKASLLHEFCGDFKSAFSAEEEKKTDFDLGGTWANIQIGGTIHIGKTSYFYGNVGKNFGSNDAEDGWQINGGFRYNF